MEQHTLRWRDVFLVALVITFVVLVSMPIPTWALDVLLALNIGISAFLLLSVLLRRGAMFATFPFVLLTATVFRLALNVSSTRLILTYGEAGRVIDAFGRVLVGDSFIVGATIFIVLIAMNYLVVVRGAERAAEVAARFALDGLPGGQLAIDSALKSGVVDATEAARQRRDLEERAQLFGAMDGTMKFVKGDAIVSMIIVAVNIVAGFLVGVWQLGMEPAAAAKTFTALTIGDGLVSQLPALLLSVTATIVVSSAPLRGVVLLERVYADLRVDQPAWIVGGVMAVVALLPGIPAFPVLVGAAAFAALGRYMATVGDSTSSLTVEVPRPIVVRVAANTVDGLHATQTRLEHHIEGARQQVVDMLGVLPPPVHLLIDAGDGLSAVHIDGVLVRADPVGCGQHRAWLAEVLCQRASRFLTLDEVATRLTDLRDKAPALVDSVPWLTLPQLTSVLRDLVDERVPIHDLERILSALAMIPEGDRTRHNLVLRARRGLGPNVIEHCRGRHGCVRYWELDRDLADTLWYAQRDAQTKFAITGQERRDLVAAVRDLGTSPTVATDAVIRRAFWELLRHDVPKLQVVAHEELVGVRDAELKGWIGLP